MNLSVPNLIKPDYAGFIQQQRKALFDINPQSLVDHLEERESALEQENNFLWNALRDITKLSSNLQEAKELAKKSLDKLDPFAPVEAIQATEEARKAS